jgi:hypothetical protein
MSTAEMVYDIVTNEKISRRFHQEITIGLTETIVRIENLVLQLIVRKKLEDGVKKDRLSIKLAIEMKAMKKDRAKVNYHFKIAAPKSSGPTHHPKNLTKDKQL